MKMEDDKRGVMETMKKCIVCDKLLFQDDPWVGIDSKLLKGIPKRRLPMEYMSIDFGRRKIYIIQCIRCHRIWTQLEERGRLIFHFESIEKFKEWLREKFKDMDVEFI